jgi:hypothetical protein
MRKDPIEKDGNVNFTYSFYGNYFLKDVFDKIELTFFVILGVNLW